MTFAFLASELMQARGYIGVFGALLTLTLVTVFVASLHLPEAPTVVIGLGIATAKAALVAMFFMHLKGEKAMVYWPLALTAFLFVALLAFILWSEADHITIGSAGFQFPDAPINDPVDTSMSRRIDAPIATSTLQSHIIHL